MAILSLCWQWQPQVTEDTTGPTNSLCKVIFSCSFFLRQLRTIVYNFKFSMSTEGKIIHSRKVPRSYKIAARICKDVSVNHYNLKSLIFSGTYGRVVR